MTPEFDLQDVWTGGTLTPLSVRPHLDDGLKILPSGQTSLIVDPPDGKIPLRPEAERRRDFNLASFGSYETMSQWVRCITREPTMLFPVVCGGRGAKRRCVE